MSISDAIPILGPLLADAQFRWWLLGLLVVVGPVPEEVATKTTKKTDVGEIVETSMITKWRFGGLLRVLMTAAASHSRLADRIASLETTVKDMGSSMSSFTAELRLWRTGFERTGVIGGQGPVSSGTRLTAVPGAGVRPEGGLRVGSSSA